MEELECGEKYLPNKSNIATRAALPEAMIGIGQLQGLLNTFYALGHR